MIALLLVFLATAGQAALPAVVGHYQAVTETEYAIELQLDASGRAELEFRTWSADDPANSSVQRFKGTWSWSGSNVTVKLASGKSATFTPVACLPYQEFDQRGCSPGLKLVTTTFPSNYGLQRFGLWRTDALRGQL